MNQTPAFVCATILMALAPLHASAQSAAQLKSENADLRAQLQAMQQRCENPLNGNQPIVSQVGPVQARIASLRIGPATGFSPGHIAVTVVMTLTNTGNSSIALNYEKRSYALTDSNGYQYNLRNEHLSEAAKEDVKGIPIATPGSASTSQMLAPGQSNSVTFIAVRNMRQGQTPGTAFDVNASFGQYQDEGHGRIRKVNTYPVAFTNVSAATAGNGAGQPGQNLPTEVGGKALDRLVDGLFKGRK